MEKPPRWLDSIAVEYWTQHFDLFDVTSRNRESFSVLCDLYSRYRQEQDSKMKKMVCDTFLRLSKDFGSTPLSSHKLSKEKPATHKYKALPSFEEVLNDADTEYETE